MADMYPVGGSKIFISTETFETKSADFVAADFATATWTEVDLWTNCGTLGDEKEIIERDYINRNRKVKIAGIRDGGTMENEFDIKIDDPGQNQMRAAQQTDNNYGFKIEWEGDDDALTPETSLFIGIVNTARRSGGTASDVQAFTPSININSNIVEVAAT